MNGVRVAAVALELGLDMANAMFGSVAYAYQRELGIPPAEMHRMALVTFEHPPLRR